MDKVEEIHRTEGKSGDFVKTGLSYKIHYVN